MVYPMNMPNIVLYYIWFDFFTHTLQDYLPVQKIFSWHKFSLDTNLYWAWITKNIYIKNHAS